MIRARQHVGKIALTIAVAGLVAGVRAADWQPPKDNLITEKQLVSYLQVQKEAIDNWRAAGKAIEGSQSSGAAMALALRNDEKFKASLVAHGLTSDEYSWVANKVWQAYGAVKVEEVVTDAQKGLEQQKKTNQQKLADLKQKLAAYEAAQKNGRRVMSKDDRDQAIASAKSDQQSALDEAKQRADEAAQAHQEAGKADDDAKAADNAAKNPPSDVSADDRPGFIEQKKTEAQQFRDAAREARDKETEAKKAEAESRSKAATAASRVANPDLAVTDDEKAEIKKQNNDQIAALKGEIADTEQGLKMLDESRDSMAKALQPTDPAPPKNVELVKRHRAEFEQSWGMKPQSKSS
jgi:hypothetical protein